MHQGASPRLTAQEARWMPTPRSRSPRTALTPCRAAQHQQRRLWRGRAPLTPQSEPPHQRAQAEPTKHAPTTPCARRARRTWRRPWRLWGGGKRGGERETKKKNEQQRSGAGKDKQKKHRRASQGTKSENKATKKKQTRKINTTKNNNNKQSKETHNKTKQNK